MEFKHKLVPVVWRANSMTQYPEDFERPRWVDERCPN